MSPFCAKNTSFLSFPTLSRVQQPLSCITVATATLTFAFTILCGINLQKGGQSGQIGVVLLMLSLAFPRGRLCENVLEGSSHHHVHTQGSSGQLLPGGQS